MDAKDCGPACLRMLAKFYGREYSLQTLRERSYINRDGVSLLGITDAANSIGFKALGLELTIEQLFDEAPLPCIIHWKQHHFVVVYAIKPGKWVKIADPAFGLIKIGMVEFTKNWTNGGGKDNQGIVLLLEPTSEFFSNPGEVVPKVGFSLLRSYIKPHRNLYTKLLIGIFLGSVLQLIFPLLTQAIVDKGIGQADLKFINVILVAMFVLVISRTLIDFLRNTVLLHLGTRINIQLVSDFLKKLMKLPLAFFDTKLSGDILQRIWDQQRIQYFLTTTSLGIIFGIFSIVIFSVVLAIYSLKILFVFLFGSLLYFLWIRRYMKKRRELDYRRFSSLAENQSALFEIITGMQEIRLNNCETEKRNKWEEIQKRLYEINMKSLWLTQYQQTGGLFFHETKNLVITFLSAWLVIKSEMTLGMMVAVQYIIGQLNSPIDQMIGFLQATQDAAISMERFGELQGLPNEESEAGNSTEPGQEISNIHISALEFRYEGPRSPAVLEDLNLDIPGGKITAIVGPSGSGKTSLLKLLLGFYPPTKGEILIDGTPLQTISPAKWRKQCGTVMQEALIFSDTIERNIAPSGDEVDRYKLMEAARVANIQSFILSLSQGFQTRIGPEGSGLSQGQKQRILIARAVYKDPKILFFDEATNALDAENESLIMSNLATFYKGRTVVIVAHRLSTVKDADQIIVLDKGRVTEIGNHEELVAKKGMYFKLVKNQLELGD